MVDGGGPCRINFSLTVCFEPLLRESSKKKLTIFDVNLNVYNLVIKVSLDGSNPNSRFQ